MNYWIGPILVLVWLGVMLSSIVVRGHNRRVDAKETLRPELDDIREVLIAARDSGERHAHEKIVYAIQLLDELK